MRKFGVSLALIGATVWSTGCGMQVGSPSTASRGGIAVVDLDKLAAETGKGAEMRDALQSQEKLYKQELVSFRDKATAELETRAKELAEKGDEATDESKREFLQIRQNANVILAKAQNTAGSQLSQLHQNQIAKFRNEFKPMIYEVAAKRGLSVVIPRNEGLLLSIDPGVDITDDVIKAYNAKRPAAAPAAAATQAAAPQAAAPAASAAKKTAASRPAAKETQEAKSSENDGPR